MLPRGITAVLLTASKNVNVDIYSVCEMVLLQVDTMLNSSFDTGQSYLGHDLRPQGCEKAKSSAQIDLDRI